MDQDAAKQLVGEAAARSVQDGQVLGLGTGSTVAKFLDALAERIRSEDLDVVGVPTSERTAEHCHRVGIALTTLDEHPRLALCIDGADEVAPGLHLTKGGGGALFREKVVATASDRFLAIVDASKEVAHLGATFQVPVEVAPYAVPTTLARLEDLKPVVRTVAGAPYVTDNGNHILDLSTGPIEDPHALDRRLNDTVGVLEHGLFLDIADRCLVATDDGVRERTT